MANELAKFINSQRRYRDQNAVNRQVKILTKENNE
jgi:hypothetical protein